MNEFRPQTGHSQDWEEAAVRLDQYLQDHGVTDKAQANKIIVCLLQKAATLHSRQPEEHPVRITMTVAFEETKQWYERLLPAASEQAVEEGAICPVALLANHSLKSWPKFFLTDSEIPDAFIQNMADHSIQTGPELRLSSMVPRDVDLPPLFEEGEITFEKLERLPFFVIISAILAAASSALVFFKLY